MSRVFQWILACDVDDIEEEDVLRFDYAGAVFAIYKISDGIFATEGSCTHERALLSDGFVIDNVIECPLHQGRFDIRSGKTWVARCASASAPTQFGSKAERSSSGCPRHRAGCFTPIGARGCGGSLGGPYPRTKRPAYCRSITIQRSGAVHASTDCSSTTSQSW